MFKGWIRNYKGGKYLCINAFTLKNRFQPDLYYFDFWAVDFHLCFIRLLCVFVAFLFAFVDFVIPYCIMAQEIIKQGIPANVLTEKAAQFKKAKSNEQLRDELPSALALYHNHSLFDKLKRFGSKSTDISKLHAGKEIEYRHLDAGFLKASNHNVVDVPLLPSTLIPVATDYNFTMSNGKRATALHVGAIEVIVQVFTSPDSDLMAGMMLVDTMHSRPENAIRSVYIVPLRSGPQMRALCFPNTLVPLNQNINKRFKMVFSLPNVDFPGGEDIAHVSVNVAGCTTGLQKSYIPSPLLTEEFNRENAHVIEYLGTHTYAMQMSNLPTQDSIANLQFDFRMGGKLELGHTSPSSAAFKRTKSLRYTIGGKASSDEEAPVAKSRSMHPAVDPRDDLVYANPQ
nr:P2AB polyprotein [Broad bean stain virus]